MIHHVAIEVPRELAPACQDFYALLGFGAVQPPESLRGRALWVERAGTQVHLLYVDAPTVPAEGHVAVVVEDHDGALAALRAAGHHPEPRREHWGSPRAFVRDPAGHRVELMAFPPGRVACAVRAPATRVAAR